MADGPQLSVSAVVEDNENRNAVKETKVPTKGLLDINTADVDCVSSGTSSEGPDSSPRSDFNEGSQTNGDASGGPASPKGNAGNSNVVDEGVGEDLGASASADDKKNEEDGKTTNNTQGEEEAFGFGDIEQLLANNDFGMGSSKDNVQSSQSSTTCGRGKDERSLSEHNQSEDDVKPTETHMLSEVASDPRTNVEEQRQRALLRQNMLDSKFERVSRRVRRHEVSYNVLSMRRKMRSDFGNETVTSVSEWGDNLHRIHEDRKRPRPIRRDARLLYKKLRWVSSFSDPEATESSSAADSDSDEEEHPCFLSPSYAAQDQNSASYKLHRTQVDWDSNRAEIGWRWNWLQLRLNALDSQIEEHTNTFTNSKNKRNAWQYENEDSGCARSRGLVPAQKRRKLVVGHAIIPSQAPAKGFTPPLAHSDRNAIRTRSAMLDRNYHLVLSLLTDAPSFVLSRAKAHHQRLVSAIRRLAKTHHPARWAALLRANRSLVNSPQKMPLIAQSKTGSKGPTTKVTKPTSTASPKSAKPSHTSQPHP
eukprot:m.334666 g.334666  ORF g.334666 m.334666 type:complete len:534 (-) comp17408_c0_seq1:86-1687(-)